MPFEPAVAIARNTAAESADSARLRKAVFAGFILSGMVTTLLGAALPILSARWSLTDARAGLFFTLLFLGSTAGMLVFGTLDRRRGHGVPLLTGYTLMALGVLLLSSGALWIARLGVFIAGLGLGFVNPSSNLLVASAPPAMRASRVSTLNSIWTIGAVSCPFLVTLAQRMGSFRAFLYLTSLTVAAVAAVFAFLHLARVTEDPAAPQKSETLGGPLTSGAWRSWINLAGLFFLYVGTESVFGGWAAAMGLQMGPTHHAVAGLMPSVFWGMLLVGRAMAPFVLRRVAELRVFLAGTALVCLSALLLLRVSRIEVLAVAMAIAGLGCSAVYPILVSWMVGRLTGSAAKLRSLAFASGNFGGATLPWVVGLVSTRFGGLRAGFYLVIGATLVIMALARRVRREAPPDNQAFA